MPGPIALTLGLALLLLLLMGFGLGALWKALLGSFWHR